MSAEKQLAAATAVKHIREGMVLGLGTGSTSAYAIRYLGELVRKGLKVQGIPTSEATHRQALAEGIPLIDFTQTSSIDICIDGADEIDENLDMIKGGGGALLREKIVASSASRYLIIVDSSKRVKQLGVFAVPVETVSFGWQVVFRKLEELEANPVLRQENDRAFVTDEGNYIIDCSFGIIDDAGYLEAELNRIPGVVENGLFVGMCDQMIMAKGDDYIIRERT